MKKLLIVLLLLASFAFANAQTPQAFSYQAAVRNAAGQVLANLPVKVRFSILDSTANGTAVFKETHTTTTTALGMINLNVGLGTPITGTLAGINWGTNAKFLQVEIDTTATGNNFTIIGVQQLMSVPYSLFSGQSSSIVNKKDCYKCPTMVSSISLNQMTIEDAITYCTNLIEQNYTNWRLPTLSEFEYLRDEIELNVPSDNCWTKDFFLDSGTPYQLSTKRNLINVGYSQTNKTVCIR
jgi:hypothetical protein